MALFFDTATAGDEAADDAVQVVDLGDLVDEVMTSPPAHLPRRRRVTLRFAGGLVLAFAVGVGLSMGTITLVRALQDDGEPSVDIEDRNLDLPADVEQPVDEDQPPQDAETPPSTVEAPAPPDVSPEEKAALKAAAGTGPSTSTTLAPTGTPGTGPGSASTGSTPATSPSTTPSTTAPATTTTPSPTLPDGSPNPLGPGPGGTTTSMPSPWDSDVIDNP